MKHQKGFRNVHRLVCFSLTVWLPLILLASCGGSSAQRLTATDIRRSASQPVVVQPTPSDVLQERVLSRYLELAYDGKFEELKTLIYLDREKQKEKGRSSDPERGETPSSTVLSEMAREHLVDGLPKLINIGKLRIVKFDSVKTDNEDAVIAVTLRSEIDPNSTFDKVFRLRRVNEEWKIVEVKSRLIDRNSLEPVSEI